MTHLWKYWHQQCRALLSSPALGMAGTSRVSSLPAWAPGVPWFPSATVSNTCFPHRTKLWHCPHYFQLSLWALFDCRKCSYQSLGSFPVTLHTDLFKGSGSFIWSIIKVPEYVSVVCTSEMFSLPAVCVHSKGTLLKTFLSEFPPHWSSECSCTHTPGVENALAHTHMPGWNLPSPLDLHFAHSSFCVQDR